MNRNIRAPRIVARTSGVLRVLLTPVAIMFVATGLWFTPASIHSWEDLLLLVLGGGAAGVSLWILIDLLKAKIIVDSAEIRRVGILKKRIPFEEIHTVKFFNRSLTVFGNGKSIMLSKDLDRQKEAIGAVTDAIRDRDDLRIFGDADMAEAYQGRPPTR